MSRKGEVTIHIGGVFATHEPTVIKTLLGSCIAACLRDPATGIGGMNHFMLPAAPNGDGEANPARFGLHAMELLIGKIQRLGGERSRLQAKVFGGGHVLQIAESAHGVPQQNIRFIREFLRTEEIPLLAHDLGGRAARYVLFDTASGKVRVRRLAGMTSVTTVVEREHEATAQQQIEQYGDVTLFED
ncbi:MAG: chemotaxis protein CheD [Candidatus Methylomirabilota bacterium]|nr:MAG: chemotaxis protein CheD [candidate division NC10 bacterium]